MVIGNQDSCAGQVDSQVIRFLFRQRQLLSIFGNTTQHIAFFRDRVLSFVLGVSRARPNRRKVPH